MQWPSIGPKCVSGICPFTQRESRPKSPNGIIKRDHVIVSLDLERPRERISKPILKLTYHFVAHGRSLNPLRNKYRFTSDTESEPHSTQQIRFLPGIKATLRVPQGQSPIIRGMRHGPSNNSGSLEIANGIARLTEPTAICFRNVRRFTLVSLA
jgi:hypothetical protein